MAGVTINPATPVSLIQHYLPIVDLVLVMSVNPGYSGQKCIEYNFDKIRELKSIREKNKYKFLIEIDGGINLSNVDKALNSGVDAIVAGSSFFSVGIEERKKLIGKIHDYK
jgi:ribulose-phosphate 3-epimerase